ncbi:MAG: flagellar protein FlhE [Lamprobacter sp.]|uniref:flagellar protein FlhE n=1 Tax=Lamprobacter sp. TaxID=3100796 RepID=UPI002B25E57E|nr:flagellar protein FlhE [Lamprobacter sp.]MEA3639777.1 flagellar protein FlhE [Lamprobacter sp.]
MRRAVSTEGVQATTRARITLLALCWLASFSGPGAWAAGSWVATAPPLRVSMAERESLSAPLQPPASVPEGEIHSLTWRFTAPPGARLRGRLCQADRCVAVDSMRGSSTALAGYPATLPLRFHFALAPQQQQAVVVGGMQLIVNYQ